MQINVQQMIQMLELIWAQMNAAASSLESTDRYRQIQVDYYLEMEICLDAEEWDRRGTGSG